MSPIINIEMRQRMVRPGERLEVVVSWSHASISSPLELSVHWFTTGKGSTSECELMRESCEQQFESGSKTFQFVVPRGPLSCEGRLISIRWEVRVGTKRNAPLRAELFDVGYGDRPIELSRFSVAQAAGGVPWIRQV